jgi:pimeloyl-ACP methyl ester carboxylesterase
MSKWGRRIGGGLVIVLCLLVGLIATQWRRDLPLDQLKAHWAGGASRFVDVDGMSVHYRDEGTGPAVVLLHGTGASLHTWDAWTAALAGQHRVVRFDLPGFGLTGPHPRDDYRTEAYVDFLDHLVARLGVDKFVVGGNSLGGTIAWGYAVAHPDKVSGLVLVDSGGYPHDHKLPLAFRIGRMPGIAQLFEHLDPAPLVRRTLPDAYGDPSRVTADVLDRYVELSLRAGNRRAFGKRSATALEDRTSELAKLHLPTLVLWGEKDTLIPVADARRFGAAITGAKVQIYPELGHVPMEEDGPRTAADVAKWLAEAVK